MSDAPTPSEADDDALLPGDYGGRGTGLAGGYAPRAVAPAVPPSYPAEPYPAPAPPAPASAALRHPSTDAGDDAYAAYDPGMAGCAIDMHTCAIAGMPHMGCEQRSVAPAPAPARAPQGPWISRGYERDAEEYADPSPPAPGAAPSAPSAGATAPGSPGGGTEATTGTGPEPGTGTGSGTPARPSQDLHPRQPGQADQQHPPKPPMGTRIVGPSSPFTSCLPDAASLTRTRECRPRRTAGCQSLA